MHKNRCIKQRLKQIVFSFNVYISQKWERKNKRKVIFLFLNLNEERVKQKSKFSFFFLKTKECDTRERMGEG